VFIEKTQHRSATTVCCVVVCYTVVYSEVRSEDKIDKDDHTISM